MERLKAINRVLMGPGPSDIHPDVLQAMSLPMIGHLDPLFVEIMNDVKSMVQQCFLTENHLSFVVSAPGSAGMETCFVNLLEPGDEAVICIHGVFGLRMADIAERCGAKVIRVEAEWGEPVDPVKVQAAIEYSNPKLVAIVHAETSTGVLQPLNEISRMTKDAGILLVVDAVTSFCGTELRVDDWKIDAIYSGTQKCLSAPPGLSPVSFSDRAVEAIEKRKSKVKSWFLDISLLKSYWAGAKRAYHHTAPVSSIFAVHEALRRVLKEGLENRWQRHIDNHLLLKEGLESLGIKFLVDPRFRLPMLNSVIIPEGVDDLEVRTRLLHEFNIEIGGGLGKYGGKIWRIGLMGESSTIRHIDLLLSALKEIL